MHRKLSRVSIYLDFQAVLMGFFINNFLVHSRLAQWLSPSIAPLNVAVSKICVWPPEIFASVCELKYL